MQTFNDGLGQIYAPPATQSDSYWYSFGQQYNFLIDVLHGSCYYQMNVCQLQANDQGNTPFSVGDCEEGAQISARLSNAQSIVANQGSSTSASSTASASLTASSLLAYSCALASAAAAQSAQAYSASKLSADAASASAAAVAAATAEAYSASSVSAAQSSSSASPTATPTASSSGRAAGDFQTFTRATGSVTAPAVTQSNGQWYQSGSSYTTLLIALQQSCYAQANSCSSNSASVNHNACWQTQLNSCLSLAQSSSTSYSTSAVAYSSSVASANFAAESISYAYRGCPVFHHGNRRYYRPRCHRCPVQLGSPRYQPVLVQPDRCPLPVLLRSTESLRRGRCSCQSSLRADQQELLQRADQCMSHQRTHCRRQLVPDIVFRHQLRVRFSLVRSLSSAVLPVRPGSTGCSICFRCLISPIRSGVFTIRPSLLSTDSRGSLLPVRLSGQRSSIRPSILSSRLRCRL